MSKLDEICKLSLDWITIVPGVILITLARLCTIIFSSSDYVIAQSIRRFKLYE